MLCFAWSLLLLMHIAVSRFGCSNPIVLRTILGPEAFTQRNVSTPFISEERQDLQQHAYARMLYSRQIKSDLNNFVLPTPTSVAGGE